MKTSISISLPENLYSFVEEDWTDIRQEVRARVHWSGIKIPV